MAEFGRGIKAGIVAGIVYGIINVVLVAGLIEFIYPGYWAIAGMVGAVGMIIAVFAVGAIIGGIIAGLIFGAIYAAAYNSLPGSSVVKGIIIAILLWLIFSVALNYGTIATYPILAVFGLMSSLVWGALVGVLWDKFGK